MPLPHGQASFQAAATSQRMATPCPHFAGTGTRLAVSLRGPRGRRVDQLLEHLSVHRASVAERQGPLPPPQ